MRALEESRIQGRRRKWYNVVVVVAVGIAASAGIGIMKFNEVMHVETQLLEQKTNVEPTIQSEFAYTMVSGCHKAQVSDKILDTGANAPPWIPSEPSYPPTTSEFEKQHSTLMTILVNHYTRSTSFRAAF